MDTPLIVFIITLVLYPLVYIKSTYSKAGIGEKPLILESTIVNFLLTLSVLGLLFCYGYLLFTSWKLLLLSVGLVIIAGILQGTYLKMKKGK